MDREPAPRSLYRSNRRKAVGWALILLLTVIIFALTAFRVLTSVVFGVFLYYGTRPIYRRLKKVRFRDDMAAISALLTVGVPAVGITGIVVASAATQAVALADPAQLQYIEPFVDEQLITDLRSIETGSLLDLVESSAARELVLNSLGTLSSLTNTLLGVLFSVLLSFTFAFFLFSWGPQLREDIVELFDDDEQVVEEFVHAVDHDMSNVFFGNMLNAVLTGVIGAVSYSVLNLFAPSTAASIPAPILLGLLTGIASFVPMVGSKIVYVPMALVIAANIFRSTLGPTVEATAGYGFVVLFLGVALVIVDTLPDMVLRPLISGKGISQGGIFLAYILGPMLFGFAGIFLMPMVVVVFINLHQIVLPGFKQEE